jgi:hypothetical protein
LAEVDPALAPYITQVSALSGELDRRCTAHRLLEPYYESGCRIPQAVVDAKMTKAYRRLMPLAEAPWGALIVDSVVDRLEVSGIRSDDKDVDAAVWGGWQDNKMDAGSQLSLNSTLVDGRSFALIWPDEDGQPEISLDGSDQMVVAYRPGSHRLDKRVAALRRWIDEDDRVYSTLYRADGLYKFQKAKQDSSQANVAEWERRIVVTNGVEEPWPVPNPFEIVPAVELAVNRRLKPGQFGYARGEYQHCIGLIDRINLLTFLGLVVAFWLGFPIRGLIGDRILRDDDGNELAPFDMEPGEVVQVENPEASTFEFSAADRGTLSIFEELSQLAAITHTPRHYFPLPGALSNIAADTIRADEGGLNAKIVRHKGSLGEGWEEVLRVMGLMLDTPVELSPRAELVWADRESRSMAERADAASKLKDVLPWQALAEAVLGATQGQIDRWAALRSSDGFGQLLGAALNPAVSAGGVILPGSNGGVPAAA